MQPSHGQVMVEPFILSWSLRPSNVLFVLAICIMASTIEEWSFMAE
ncbi:unnamed protein product [Brassica rapa]|uniref:Uncharacterized protein n=1 Tax=Brassica campestris TaxID=3711 RepID=A0A8D9DCT8_BRACM|nr:unnamed protein product [Brassica rapa]